MILVRSNVGNENICSCRKWEHFASWNFLTFSSVSISAIPCLAWFTNCTKCKFIENWSYAKNLKLKYLSKLLFIATFSGNENQFCWLSSSTYNIYMFVTSKKRNHEFTNFKHCKKAREDFKPLFNDILFLV